MKNVSLSTMESSYTMSWGYEYNAGYFFMPSKLEISYTDTGPDH
ncbi:hypothetical protein [Anaerocolumna xylanovorans]|nr:hypothetical protein [Anaerocolumna xylanovorans]